MKKRTLPEKTEIECNTKAEYEAVLDALGVEGDERKRLNFGWNRLGVGACVSCKNQNIYASGVRSYSLGYTIIPASEWLVENQAIVPLSEEFIENVGIPVEDKPAWKFQTEEDMEMFLHEFSVDRRDVKEFLEFMRNPAFELITADGAKITDPEQDVYWCSPNSVASQPAGKVKEWGYTCFSTEQAALSQLKKMARVICLDDLGIRIEAEEYFIPVYVASKLVNQRLKNEK